MKRDLMKSAMFSPCSYNITHLILLANRNRIFFPVIKKIIFSSLTAPRIRLYYNGQEKKKMPRKPGQTKKILGEKTLGFLGDNVVIETNLGPRVCQEVPEGRDFVYREKGYKVVGEVPEGARVRRARKIEVEVGGKVSFPLNENQCWGVIEAIISLSEKRDAYIVRPFGEKCFGHVVLARADFYPVSKVSVDKSSWEWRKWREWNAQYLRLDETVRMYEIIKEKGINIDCPL
jgi:hypothetical protein